MSVTIKDILDAGGDIFGLPVETPDGRGICVTTRAEFNGDISVNFIPDDNRACYLCKRCPANKAVVYPDGIRVLEIDGKLYRVKKVAPDPDKCPLGKKLSQRNIICWRVQIEPIIPDKLKQLHDLVDIEGLVNALKGREIRDAILRPLQDLVAYLEKEVDDDAK